MKENVKWTECMKIYKADEPLLFSIGDEIAVTKKGMKITSEMNKEMNYFNPSRIIFIQLKDPKQHPNRQRMCITSLTADQFVGKLDDDNFDPMKCAKQC